MKKVTFDEMVNEVPLQHQARAQSIFEHAFDSLLWTEVVDGIVKSRRALSEWHHRDLAEIESDITYLEINRQQLLSALSEYLSNPDLSSSKSDWFFLNTLSYCEYLATVTDIRKKIMGIDRFIKSGTSPKRMHSHKISVYQGKEGVLVMLLVANGFGWVLTPLLGTIITIYTMLNSFKEMKYTNKINALQANLLNAYLSFNNTELSWSQVRATLELSSSRGAIWDASLFKLAECRQANTSTKI